MGSRLALAGPVRLLRTPATSLSRRDRTQERPALTETRDLASGTDTSTTYGYGLNNASTVETKKEVSESGVLVRRETYEYDFEGRVQVATVETLDAARDVTSAERAVYDYDVYGQRVRSETDADFNGTFAPDRTTEYHQGHIRVDYQPDGWGVRL